MKKTILFLTLCLLAASNCWAQVVSKPVNYSENGQTLQGFLYYDDAAQGKLPGVIVVHEWKGLGDYAKKRAEMLAELGYAAFAADMYGKGIFAKDHETAGKLAGVYFQDRNRMRARAQAAYQAFIQTGKVDESRVAAIGYCFGGTTVLEMARSGMPLKGVVSFHGVLATPSPAEKGKVKAPVWVMTGGADKMVSAENVREFKKEMKAAGAKYKVTVFKEAMHSFTVWDANMPEKGILYNAPADKKSWMLLQKILKTILKNA